MNRDLTNAIRSAFTSPRDLCAKLGVDTGAKAQPRDGLFISCPWHAERSPSCSVFVGPDGTVAVKCWGCEVTGDALTLIAQARGLGLRSQFKLVLQAACEIGGLWRELEQLLDGKPPETAPAPVQRAPAELPPERTYPDARELRALWEAAHPVTEDGQAKDELLARGLDPVSVAGSDLIRVIPADRWLPRWARYQGMTWNTTGHRLMVLTYDADGAVRSMRAWRVSPSDTPKRLPPAGHRSGELVLANRYAVGLFRGHPVRSPVVICEGEPDWLVRTMVTPGLAVIGIGSGSWHDGFAARIQYGGEVIVRTHRDAAGERYADRVIESLRDRAHVHRLVVDEPEVAA